MWRQKKTRNVADSAYLCLEYINGYHLLKYSHVYHLIDTTLINGWMHEPNRNQFKDKIVKSIIDNQQ